MNIEAMKDEIRCISTMLSKESERHTCKVNPLLERQLALINRIRKAGSSYLPNINERGGNV